MYLRNYSSVCCCCFNMAATHDGLKQHWRFIVCLNVVSIKYKKKKILLNLQTWVGYLKDFFLKNISRLPLKWLNSEEGGSSAEKCQKNVQKNSPVWRKERNQLKVSLLSLFNCTDWVHHWAFSFYWAAIWLALRDQHILMNKWWFIAILRNFCA